MRPLRPLTTLLCAPALLVAALLPASASAASSYERCDDVAGASVVQAARTSCSTAREVAAAVVAAPPGRSAEALQAVGWRALRAQAAGGSGEAHDLVALRGRAAVRVRRAGAAPDLDGWSAGRELVFARSTIVGGRPIPRGASFCTSSFLVRLAGRGSLGGVSAAHCAGLRSDGRVQRRNGALRRPPAPGVVLGRVQRMLSRSAPLDALLLPIPQGEGRSASPVVDRGVSRPPWAIDGSARPLAGRRVCFSGRTSGIDRCGSVRGSSSRAFERLLARRNRLVVRCTTISARGGDSGGPVYTAPSADGTVRAVGIVTLVTGRRNQMCFTPIGPVLDRLGARLVVAGR